MSSSNTDALFQQLDNYLANVVEQLAPNQRRRLSRQLAYGLRQRNQKRIGRQQNPDGGSYIPRKNRVLRTQGGVRFLWKEGVRELTNWRTTGRGDARKITGFDTDRGAVRSFYKRDIQRYLEINTSQTKRRISRTEKMFRRLRTARFLKASATANEATVGFNGRTSQIASVHQYGEVDNVAEQAKTRYPVRELLGFSHDDIDWIADSVVNFLQQD
ncbi:phage virion morphogenesis protein [Limnobaculum xujianqingii]|uniref:phage virion morphogenesis protein n=1 Tax=Limnobaculum xujianqingii TaxID=2738837 RepID=UPI00112BA842|nr:phage virion morphogenesis protein [Limnobaculum xujianqingii]